VRRGDGTVSEVRVDGAAVPHVVVGPETHLVAVLRAMEEGEARVAVVVEAGRDGVLGMVGDREIAALARSTARLME
jgi:CBS domain-containing protein